MPSSSPAASNRSASPNRRRKQACQYCFKRKMKCDLKEPRCTNCEEQGKDCVPAERSTRARPTHGRIEELEREVERLQARLREFHNRPPAPSFEPLAVDPNSLGASTSTLPIVSHGSANPSYGNDNRDMWIRRHRTGHGPTSAFYDEENGLINGAFDIPNTPTVPETELREQATAQCAAERHMEILNLASGKLDFDGVPADLAMHLLAMHWNRQHFAFMISYRPLFMRDMACQGPYFSKLLLNAIFFSVSKFSDRPECYDDPMTQTTAGSRFLRRIKELLGAALDQSSIPTIQAMLLLSSSLFALGYQSAAWLYSGIALRMIFDLGLNFDCAGQMDLRPEEIEIRRRVVWACYISDKIISLYQGRSVSFEQERLHVPRRFLDRYEEQELWTPFAFPGIHHYPGAPARALSTFTALCSLSVIMERIITDVYADKGPLDRPDQHLTRLASSLDRWFQDLPKEIAYDPSSDDPVPPPHVLSLHSMYYTVVTLLHRPFVESGLHQVAQELVPVCWARCEMAAKGATDVLTRYRQTFTLARAPYLISYTTYVAATIHVRMVAQRGIGSESAQLLRVCLEGLRENSATNPGVNKMYNTINRVMERLNVKLDAEMDGVMMPTDMGNEELDFSAIIRSFGVDQGGNLFSDLSNSNGYDQSPLDNLYGFLGLQRQ